MHFFTITARRAAALVALAAGMTLAHAQKVGSLEVSQAWARPTVAGQGSGGGYLVLTNRGTVGDRLVAAQTALADRVEMHRMSMEGDVMRMRPVESIEVPAGATVALQPGGLHLMFIGLKAPLAEGQQVPLLLRFEKAGEVAVKATVQAQGSAGSAAPAGAQGKHQHH